MKTRADLKLAAKSNLKRRYLTTMISLILCIAFVVAISLIPVVGIFSSFFIVIPLSVGINSYFIRLSKKEKPTILAPFTNGFCSKYFRKLFGMLWCSIWIFLWTLLLIIPGIIKSFSYAMVPYILADCPNVSGRRALKLSKHIMKGHKLELFILYCSFFLWAIFSALFLMIPMVLFVAPYMQATYAEYYNNLIQEAIDKRIVTPDELGRKNSMKK